MRQLKTTSVQPRELGYSPEGYRNPVPTTDLIIEYSNGAKEGIILIERLHYPFGIAIPGGFAEWGISLEANAVKEAKEETGLEVKLLNPESPLCVHSDPKRDPRGHMISVAYIAQGFGELKAGDDAKKAELYSIAEVKALLQHGEWAFADHKRIVEKYLQFRNYP